MKLNIPHNEKNNKYLIMLNLFSFISPYSLLNNREKQVLSELFMYDYEFRNFNEDKRNRFIFDYDTRVEIADKLNISTDNVYNIMASLKRKGFLKSKGLVRDKVLPNTEQIIINFIDGKN